MRSSPPTHLTTKIPIPELLHYLLSSVDPSGMGGKITQNLELSWVEIGQFPAGPDLTTRKINSEVGKFVLQVCSLGVYSAGRR